MLPVASNVSFTSRDVSSMVESLELEESFAVSATIATDTATTDHLTVTDLGSATLQLDASFNISESRSSGRNQGRVSVLLCSSSCCFSKIPISETGSYHFPDVRNNYI